MRAITVTATRDLETRDVPAPTEAPNQHLLVQIEAAAINHGDKTFLKMPAAALGLNTSQHDIWGVSAAGRVLRAGADVPEEYVGRKVAIYRSLTPSAATIGLWSERAVVPVTSCVLLPEELSFQEYSGSLVNVITAYAFLEEAASAGHAGAVVTVGGSATGLALAALARRRQMPALFLVRSQDAADRLRQKGIERVLVTSDAHFDDDLERLATQLGTTAVFDGVGGKLVTRMAPRLPRNATVWFYGFSCRRGTGLSAFACIYGEEPDHEAVQ